MKRRPFDDRSAQQISVMLALRRADWLPRYFPSGRLRGDVFLLGNADGDPGESLPVPLRASQARFCDFAGDFAGDDLALLARATGRGADMKAAFVEAMAYLWLGGEPMKRREPPPSEPPPPAEDKRERAQEIWRQTEAITHGLPFDYLTRRRGITHWDCDRVRWHPCCRWGNGTAGCIVAPVVCSHSGYTVAIHRIRPTMQGEVRRLTFGPISGNFSPVTVADGDEIAITEGIEDALAFTQLDPDHMPAWSAFSAGNMAALVLPQRFRRVIINADRDPNRVGIRAAIVLADRLRAEGRSVSIEQSRIGKDANDALRAQGRPIP